MIADATAPATCHQLSIGFVIAMRAHVVGLVEPTPEEWLIVARWGSNGSFVSISWTDLPADTADVPILLQPKRTIIGRGGQDARRVCSAVFHLIDDLPDSVATAGVFVPASGEIRLTETKDGTHLRCTMVPLHDVGGGQTLEANRVAWIGEFVERLGPPGG